MLDPCHPKLHCCISYAFSVVIILKSADVSCAMVLPIFRWNCVRKWTISLSQMSKAKLVWTLPWREIALLRTISLSQMSKAKLVWALPWREIALLRTISLSQMSKAKLVWALPWREIALLRTSSQDFQSSGRCPDSIGLWVPSEWTRSQRGHWSCEEETV